MCYQWWGFSTAIAGSCWDSFIQHESLVAKSNERLGWVTVWFSLVWAIWTTRNNLILEVDPLIRQRLLIKLRFKPSFGSKTKERKDDSVSLIGFSTPDATRFFSESPNAILSFQ
ncbi:hypothetical protein SLE2022_395830 [Rubroshorea leprosula]